MAKQTVQLPMTKVGWVDQTYSGTHFTLDSNTWYSVLGSDAVRNEKRLYAKFERMPAALRHQYLYCVQFRIAVYTQGSSYLLDAYFCEDDFDEDTITYANSPSNSGYSDYINGIVSGITSNYDITFPAYDESETYRLKSSKVLNPKKTGSLYFHRNETTASRTLDLKTQLQNGNTPYLIVTYDDAIEIPWMAGNLTVYSDGIITSLGRSFVWQALQDTSLYPNAYCAEGWDADSGKFYWRYSGESNWNEINATITDGKCSVTIAPYTFRAGSTIEYYASITIDGVTKNTETTTAWIRASQITPYNSPTSGYRNPRNAISFSWRFAVTGSSTTYFDQQSAALHWKVSTDTNYTTVSASGTNQSITIAANTFPTASTIQWYLTGTDASGYSSTSPVYSFSTAAGTANAQALAPIDTIVDRGSPILFQWSLSSTDGQTPSRVQLSYKLDTDGEWQFPFDVYEAATSYTAPANSIPAGQIYWTVRAFNIDGTAGPWSKPTSTTFYGFICLGAPDPPTVYVEETPFATIGWQADEQQAYEIMVDDTTYGPYFGVNDSFEIPDYLSDGAHSIKVRVQGNYGLWSNWGEALVEIEDESSETVELECRTGIDAELFWLTSASAANFYVYRDGILIGRTSETTFKDRFALGVHEYYVVNRYSDGNYSKSNTVECLSEVYFNCIAALEGGEWIELLYSLKQDESFAESVTAAYIGMAGHTFPVAAVGEQRNTSVSFTAVFLFSQIEDKKKFAALLGKPVVVKLKSGDVEVCLINSWTRTEKSGYYTAYTITAQKIDWEDFTNGAA